MDKELKNDTGTDQQAEERPQRSFLPPWLVARFGHIAAAIMYAQQRGLGRGLGGHVSKHAGAKRPKKNAAERRKTRRLMAKASRHQNRK